MQHVYVVTIDPRTGRRHWKRAGTATVNKDGTTTVKLDLPSGAETGTLILRDPIHTPEPPVPPQEKRPTVYLMFSYCEGCGRSIAKKVEGNRPQAARMSEGKECPWCGK